MFKRTTTLGRAVTFLTGVLIGLIIVSPVFAATSIVVEDWQTPVLLGSIALLVIGVALEIFSKAQARKKASQAVAPADDEVASRNMAYDVRLERPSGAGVDPMTLAPRQYARTGRFESG